eukprot:gene19336-21256_t
MPRLSTKKRKGFHGKQKWEIVREESSLASCRSEGDADRPKASQMGPGTPTTHKFPIEVRNMSAEKLLNTDFQTLDDKIITRNVGKRIGLSRCKPSKIEKASGNKIQDFSLLQQCLESFAICSKCKSAKSNLKIFQVNKKKRGLGEHMFIKCSNCKAQQDFLSSKKVSRQGGGFEVNRRAALATSSREKLKRVCSWMNLPPPVAKKPYNSHLKDIETSLVAQAEEKMNAAAARLVEITRTEEPSKLRRLENGKVVAQIAVTVDGTWQKRGHTSKIGVVFILSVRTGEVLDYEVLSQVCHECIHYNKLDKESSAYKQWAAKHHDNCSINHKGSSGSMEGKGATFAFKRSIEKRSLMYAQFVGNGDSSCFGTVLGAVKEEFGDSYPIEKEECVGHIQKRMGAALLEYKKKMKGQKLSDGKNVGGPQRLTKDLIKRIQNYYGLSIRQNKGNLKGMKKAITAIQHHLIQDPGKPLSHQHRFCPKGKESWCRFWKDKAKGSSNYKNIHRLPHVFMAQLQPIFQRLSDSELLRRCLLGLTQNQNESLNGRLWSLIPKTTFCGKRRVVICACETICVSNTGAASNYMLLEKLGIEPGENTLRSLRQEDNARVRNAGRKVSEKCRTSRKNLKFQKKKEKKTCLAYKAGGFGTMSVPDEMVAKKEKHPLKKAKKENNRKRKQNVESENGFVRTSKKPRFVDDVEIIFIDETSINHLQIEEN